MGADPEARDKLCANVVCAVDSVYSQTFSIRILPDGIVSLHFNRSQLLIFRLGILLK